MIGVRYCGTAQDYSGVGDSNRQDIAALFTAGVPLTTELVVQVPERTDFGLAGDIANRLTGRPLPYKIKIIHLSPDMIPRYKEDGVYTIARVAWETSKLPPEWVKGLNQVNEVWTMSEMTATVIKNSGVKRPVFVFPEAIDVTKADEQIAPLTMSYPKDFTFYAIFQWIARKNPRTLLRAYWKAFEGIDNVTLLLKTYGVNYTDQQTQAIKEDIYHTKQELGLKSYPKIYLAPRLLKCEQVARLHALGDCYVNASSGEGWARGIQEAMLYGKPVIAGNVGGITDYMGPYFYSEVESKVVQATEQSHIPWYTSDMQWRELDENNLMRALQDTYGNQNGARAKAKKAQQFIIDNFSYQKVGLSMRQRLEAIEKTL